MPPGISTQRWPKAHEIPRGPAFLAKADSAVAAQPLRQPRPPSRSSELNVLLGYFELLGGRRPARVRRPDVEGGASPARTTVRRDAAAVFDPTVERGSGLADLPLRGTAAQRGDDPCVFILLPCAMAGLCTHGRAADGTFGVAPASTARVRRGQRRCRRVPVLYPHRLSDHLATDRPAHRVRLAVFLCCGSNDAVPDVGHLEPGPVHVPNGK